MALTDIARNACPVTAPDGTQFIFFNTEIIGKGTTNYIENVETGDIKYSITFNSEEQKKRYRALHYARYYLNSSIELIPRVVPFIGVTPEEVKSMGLKGGTVYASPLYEAINPSATPITGFPGTNLVFWTNLTKPLIASVDGIYQYNRSVILKFETDKLEDYDLDLYTNKALCAAVINWEYLKTNNGLTPDTKPVITPVISSVFVLMTENNRVAVDFSNGSAGRMNLHNHADNRNGGFAYSVFAPGTTVQPINWR